MAQQPQWGATPTKQTPPKFDDLVKIIAAGERRLAFLDNKIDDAKGDRRAFNSRQYDMAERLFTKAGLAVLRYHRAAIDPETSPLEILRLLLEELKKRGLPGNAPDHDSLAKIMARGRRALLELL